MTTPQEMIDARKQQFFAVLDPAHREEVLLAQSLQRDREQAVLAAWRRQEEAAVAQQEAAFLAAREEQAREAKFDKLLSRIRLLPHRGGDR